MLTMKDVIREGHPTLTKKAEEVSIPLDEETKKTLKDMMQFLINSQTPEIAEKYELRPGVGLAAPQINVSKRMIAVLATNETGEKLYKLLLVNPKIVSHSVQKTYIPGGEGCLSVDREVEGNVLRHKKIRVRAHQYKPENDTLLPVEIRVSGYIGVVLQHEIDHLNGILFPTKIADSVVGIDPIIFPEFEAVEED